MERRGFIVGCGASLTSSLSGCLGGSDDENGPTQTPTSSPTAEDDRTGTGTDSQNVSETPDLHDELQFDAYSVFTDYSREFVTVEVKAGSYAPNYPNGARLGIYLADYGNIHSAHAYKESETFSEPVDSTTVTVDLEESGIDHRAEDGQPYFFVAYIMDGDADSINSSDANARVLCESDRFQLTSSGIDKLPLTEHGLDPRGNPTDDYYREVMEGWFLVTMRGTVNGTDWEYELPYLKSKYREVARQRDPTPESTLQRTYGSGPNVFTVGLQATLNEAGFQGGERVEFFMDWVRTLPDSPTINSGYHPSNRKHIPITVMEGGGDVYDVSLVLAGAAWWDGRDACAMFMEDHVAAGISGDFSGLSVDFEGVTYYWVDAAVDGGGIGDYPSEFSATNPGVYVFDF